MQNFRWKWIGYYAFSSAVIASVSLAMVAITVVLYEFKLEPVNLAVLVLSAVTAAVVIGVIFGFLFSRSLHSKLNEIILGVKKLTYGDLSYRLAFVEDQDLGEIASAFNEMADRIDAQVTSLQKLAEENEQLIQQAKTAAVSEERQRLAQELHDAVSQELFAISLTSATAAKLFEGNPNQAAELLRHIEKSAAKAQAEMRALLLQLRPQTLEEQSLIDAIQSLAEELTAKMPIKCHLKIADLTLPSHIENQLYRILQEGLANVLRHSQASNVEIKLESYDSSSRVHLTIEDDGVGFSKENIAHTSYGIRTIKERVGALGGTAEWISIPGRGTRLEARIPIRR